MKNVTLSLLLLIAVLLSGCAEYPCVGAKMSGYTCPPPVAKVTP